MKQRVDRLVSWIQHQVSRSGAAGAVFGLSGGLDSSVVAALCMRAFPEASLGVIMPCYSNPVDERHARLVARKFKVPVKKVALDGAFDALVAVLPKSGPAATRRIAQANLKARLRMVTLYYVANRLNRLVMGSGDRSELAVGYFTKYGDGGVDLLPIGGLTKTEVRAMAVYLGVPREVTEKLPSPGLWDGQTAEGELGLSYAEVDRYLLEGRARAEVRRKVDRLKAASEHKRMLCPIAPTE